MSHVPQATTEMAQRRNFYSRVTHDSFKCELTHSLIHT